MGNSIINKSGKLGCNICNIATLEILHEDMITDVRRYGRYVVVEELGEELMR